MTYMGRTVAVILSDAQPNAWIVPITCERAIATESTIQLQHKCGELETTLL